MTTEHEVRALVAERLAAVVDDAVRRGDEAAMLRASDKLLEVLDTLPVRKPGGGAAGDGGSSGGAVLELFEGGPTMGDVSSS